MELLNSGLQLNYGNRPYGVCNICRSILGVLLFGTIYGVVIGVILSFIAVIVKAVEPPRAFLGVIPGQEGFYSLNRYRNVKKIKGVVIYRFNGALFFANINTFVDDIERILMIILNG